MNRNLRRRLAQTKSTAEAQQVLNDLLAGNPPPEEAAKACIQTAAVARLRNDLSIALQLLDQATRIRGPHRSEAHYEAAMCASRLGDQPRTKRHYRLAIEAAPTNLHALFASRELIRLALSDGAVPDAVRAISSERRRFKRIFKRCRDPRPLHWAFARYIVNLETWGAKGAARRLIRTYVTNILKQAETDQKWMMRRLGDSLSNFPGPACESRCLVPTVLDVDELDVLFDDGDRVTTDTLRQRDVIAREQARLHVTGCGPLTRRLTVVADSFTETALAAIRVAGGVAIKKRH